MKLIYVEHSCFIIEFEKNIIIVDPFASDLQKLGSYFESTKNKYALLTHGHNDHFDALLDLNIDKLKIISNFEICNFLDTLNIGQTISMNIGGTIQLEQDLKITMVPAIHSSSITYNSKCFYGGLACGYIIDNGKHRVYHAGDTSIFSDMKLIDELYKPDVGLIPVGNRFTMGVKEASFACNNFFHFKFLVPMHYNTFPPISINIEDLKVNLINQKQLVVMKKFDEIEV